MQNSNRRTFLKRSGLGLAGATLVGLEASARAARANERIGIGVIGCGGRGRTLGKIFAGLDHARVTMVCDPDSERSRRAAEEIGQSQEKAPSTQTDLRQVLADPAVDAVAVATPDHWHGPAAILACAAGKHVYVEKPCAHNLREGRQLVEAARRHRRLVQIGTQGRTTEHIAEAIARLYGGAIGEVLVAKAWNSQRRADIGRARPSDPPAGLDYELWLGPAPFVPYQENRLHYSWHWWHAFGTGGMGNDGIHEVDMARWGLGVDRHPNEVSASGGKLFFEDDQEFPDTQYACFLYTEANGRPAKQLIYEQRLWSPYVQEEQENGVAFYGTKGMLLLGRRSGWKLYGPRNKLIESMPGSRWYGTEHCQNFLDAIRGRAPSRATIETGHRTTTLVHLGNAAIRAGRSFRFDPEAERALDCDRAQALLGRDYREGHWAVPAGV